MTAAVATAGPGRTTISGRTVERIAAHALTEQVRHRPKVSASISGDTVALDVRLALDYPASVARATAEARQHVTRRLDELTGLQVSTVDIKVTALHPPAPQRRVQ